MLTLTLDGLPVDLPADAAIALSVWAHDLRRSKTREATYSETFTLPPSAQNAAALRVPHALDTLSAAPYRKLAALLQANGVTVLDGVAVLEGTGPNGYDLTLYADVADLFALVGDTPLRALDLSAYDHALTYANVAAANGNTAAQGYAYPLADDGRLLDRPAAEGIIYHELPPFVFAHTILSRLVAEHLPGYTLTGSLLQEDRYQRLGFPRARPFPVLRQSVRDGLALTASRRTPVTYTAPPNTYTYDLLTLPDVDSAGAVAGPAFAAAGVYTVPAGLPCDVHVEARLLVRVSGGSGAFGTPLGAALRLVWDPNGVPGPADTRSLPPETLYVGLIDAGGTATPAPPVAARWVTLQGTLARVLGAAGVAPLVAVQVIATNGLTVTVEQATVAFTVGERTYPGGPVHLEAGLPDISQADFLQLLATQFQAVFQADPARRLLRADLFTDLERNRTAAAVRHWTAKLDRSSGPATAFRLDGYAQANAYAYAPAPAAYDTLGLPPGAATAAGALAVPDATLPTAAEAYTAPVAVTHPHAALANAAALAWLPAFAIAGPGDGHTGTGYRPYDPGKQYSTADVPVVYNGRYWQWTYPPLPSPFPSQPGPGTPPGTAAPSGSGTYVIWSPVPESKLYTVATDELPAVALLTAAPLPQTGPVLARPDDGGTARFTPVAGLTSDGLHWGRDLLPAYYATLAALLTRCRILRLPFTLSAVDIASYDALRPVRLDIPHWPGVGAVRGDFYVNLIDQHRPGQPGSTVVELIRLGEPVAGIAPAAAALPLRPARALFGEDGYPLRTEPGTGAALIEE